MSACDIATCASAATKGGTYPVDAVWTLETTRRLIECDSTVGYYPEIEPLLKGMVEELGYEMFWDRKHTGYVRVPGRDRSHTVCLGAHLDTIGLVVRGINDDGTLRVRKLGGINYASIEGETCRVHCRDGRVVDGEVICNHHSVHVFEDARETPRDENHMSVSIIGDVKSADDARALGITQGAVVSIDPHFECFDNGYVVSRHIDDKACVAALLGAVRWMGEAKVTPACDLLLAFPMYEEIGHGASYVPADVDEYVAIDITLIGPDYDADEHHVGVIASDHHGPYDWDLTNSLIKSAERAIEKGGWDTQVCFHYSTDAMAAYIKGCDLYAAAFGPACLNTHGRERCHVDAIVRTQQLACAYIEDLSQRYGNEGAKVSE